jgi:hypothetical protein
MTSTRPDIGFHVGLLSRYFDTFSDYHFNVGLKVLKYIRSTADAALVLDGRVKNYDIVGYGDADWGGSIDDKKSTTGNLMFIGNGLVSWISRKQELVAVSTAEAEYYALYSACQESKWIQSLLSEIGVNPKITLHCDNISCIKLASSGKFQSGTKHIDIKYHALTRNYIQNKAVDLKYCNTTNMKADGLTKGIGGNQFTRFVNGMGLSRASSGSVEG